MGEIKFNDLHNTNKEILKKEMHIYKMSSMHLPLPPISSYARKIRKLNGGRYIHSYLPHSNKKENTW
jgi:hypothetical protein